MSMKIDLELCTGCGECVVACPNRAIYLIDRKAEIDADLCEECGTCVEICPVGAVLPVEDFPLPMIAQTDSAIVEAETASLSHSTRLVPLVGTTLAYIGKEVTPHIVDIIIDALERRLHKPAISASNKPTIGRLPTTPGGGRQKRARRRLRQRGMKGKLDC